PIRRSERARESVTIVLDLALLKHVQRIHDVARQRRLFDGRVELAGKRTGLYHGIDLHIGLEEAQPEEDAGVLTLIRRGATVKRAHAQVDLLSECLIDVQPEVLA